MKPVKTLILVGALGLSVAIGTVCSTISLAADAPAAPAHKEDHEALEHAMEQMGKAFKGLRQQIADPTKAPANLELIATLQRGTVEAKRHLPPSIMHLPEADRKTKAVEYQQMMINLLRAELDVEDALLEGNTEKAVAALNSVHDLEEAGHQDFRPKEDH